MMILKSITKQILASAMSVVSLGTVSTIEAIPAIASDSPDNPQYEKAGAEQLAQKIRKEGKGWYITSHAHPQANVWEGVTYAKQGITEYGNKSYKVGQGDSVNKREKIDSISVKSLSKNVRGHESSGIQVKQNFKKHQEIVTYAFWDTTEFKSNGKVRTIRHYVKDLNVKWGQKF